MKLKIALVEDEDRTGLATLIRGLGGGEDFDVVPLSPPSDLDVIKLLNDQVDLFLVDYELDTVQPNGSLAPYRGLTFAARLREIWPAYPISLFTRSDLPAWTAARRTATAGASFDDIIYKDTGLQGDRQGTHAKLISLARGYRTLRESETRTLSALLDLLETDQTGQNCARQAQPPPDGWQEFEAAHWIRSTLLHYPGVLYNDAHAATALGISVDSFKEDAVQYTLEAAAYQGPFFEEQRRWWRHSLFDIATRICAASDGELGVREAFPRAAGEKLGVILEPSKDDYSGISPADTVCYLLGVPVRIETSLPYQPDSRPPTMEEARISFRAIRETNDVQETYIDLANRAKVDEIRALSG